MISTRHIVRICIKRTRISIEYGYTDTSSRIILVVMVHALLVIVVITVIIIVIVTIVFVPHTRRLQRHGIRYCVSREMRAKRSERRYIHINGGSGEIEKETFVVDAFSFVPSWILRHLVVQSKSRIMTGCLGNFSACFT